MTQETPAPTHSDPRSDARQPFHKGTQGATGSGLLRRVNCWSDTQERRARRCSCCPLDLEKVHCVLESERRGRGYRSLQLDSPSNRHGLRRRRAMPCSRWEMAQLRLTVRSAPDAASIATAPRTATA